MPKKFKPLTTLARARKCEVCGRLPVFSPRSNHCYGCHQIIVHMNKSNIHGQAAQEILEHVRRNGHVCQYTKTPLNMTDPKDPFYFVFDHMIPGDNSKIRLTFALLNEMKSDMILREFWYYVRQVDRCFRTGARIRKLKLSRWYRLIQKKLRQARAKGQRPPHLAQSSRAGGKKCWVCGKPVYAPGATYCYPCHKFFYAMDNRRINNDAAKKIRKFVRRRGFVCQYTGTPLDMTDYADPFYYEFDHTVPGDNSQVALTFSLLNEMKSQMTLKEFKYYIHQFVIFLDTGAPIKKRKLSRWFV